MMRLENFKVEQLSKKVCLERRDELLELLKTIPNSHYKIDDIVAEKKGDRVLYGKWEYSLIVLDKENIVGVLIAYERKKEEEGIYQENCFYINEIVVSKKYKGQGIGKALLEIFIEKTEEYKYLDGKVKIRIQTTNSEENKKVIELYERVGFRKVGIKKYQLKEDVVLEINK